MKPIKPEEFLIEVPSPPTYIQYKGVWNMQDLFESVVDFFRHQKFKFQEKSYVHKQPSPFGVDRKYIWEARRKVEDFYEFVVDIFMHTYDARDMEVKMPDGSKKIFTKGRIWIQIMGNVNVDYEKKWEENSFYAQLRNFYTKYIIQKKFEAIWWDELHYKVCNKLRNLIQQRLKIESEEYETRYFAGVH